MKMPTPIITNTEFNFSKAENDLFSWSDSDGTSGNMLFHKPSGRSIYQMHWLDENGKMADRVEGETRENAIIFWDELRALQAEKQNVHHNDDESWDGEIEPPHGENGYCRLCHSYCYSDCEANGVQDDLMVADNNPPQLEDEAY